MSETLTPVILVDGSSYLFRAYHALPPLTNSDGHPTGAMRGVINMIRSLQKNYPGSKVIVVFDAKGKTFRNDLYKEYKAHRPPMPDDLREQIQPIHDIIKAMGLPLLVIEGVEADDVIGTLATEATEKGIDTIISTGDKDMAQLVSDHVTLINTMEKDEKKSKTDIEGVIAKFGVRPDQIIDYLALMGDKVDNIPGVEKCGPKTAVKWLDAYGSLQGVMDNADQVKGKIGENLRAALEQLPLSYELATIKCDVELEENLDSIEVKPADKDELLNLFKKYEFKTWIAELTKGSGASVANPNANADEEMDDAPTQALKTETDCILDKADFEAWLKKLEDAECFAFDTETTSLNYMDAEIVGVSFAVEAGKAAYVPVAHDYEGAPNQLDRDYVLNALKPLLEDPTKPKVGQHLKYDKHVLANHSVSLEGIEFDTMLESYVLNSVATRHDMNSLALKYLGHDCIHFEDIAGKGAKQKTFNQIEIEQAAPYAAEDADITLQLHLAIWSKLEKVESLLKVYQEIEKPLIPVLESMEHHGALLDSFMLEQQSEQIAQRLDQLEQEAYKLAGEEFNLASPKQLQVIFFEKLSLPIIKKTPKGAPSTAEDVLQELALDYPLPKIILEHRSLAKLKSTYTDKLPKMVNAKTQRLHTSYHQAIAATGRLSSTDPNLQNIPIKTEEGRRIRQAFVAPTGYKLIAADYSQIELRIMAHLSGDEGLLKAFQDGLDVHRATAAEVFGVDVEAVTDNQRRSAKAVNFGLIYGMSAFGLSNQLGVTRKEAQGYIDTYFERYPGVQRYMDDIRTQAGEQGFVETIFGRRLYLPEIKARNAMRRQAAERTAINAPMQGSAADIIKRAMLDLHPWISKEHPDVRMIMQVHDELIFEVPEAKVEQLAEEIKSRMEHATELDVPLIVDAGIGDNWDEAH